MTQGGLTRRTVLCYASPAIALAIPTIPVYLYLPTLYGAELGLALTGVILLVARLFDTLADPVVGALSDRLRSRFGRRKPWIAVGAVLAGFGLYQLLHPPAVPDGRYLLSASILLYTGWTMVAVPFLAWGAELSPDYNQRTEIVAWREAAGVIGIVAAGAVGAVLMQSGWVERDAIGILAWCAIVVGAVTIPVLLWRVPDPVASLHSVQGFSIAAVRAVLADLVANRPFLRLLVAWFVNGLANGIPAALFMLYLEHALGATEAERAVLILLYFLAAISGMPLWSVLSQRYGKHKVWCGAMLLACAAFIAVPLLEAGDILLFGVICVLTGLALGADLVLPPAIQADVVDYEAMRSGDAKTGFQFALWNMGTKLALAVAVGLALPLVGALGFDPSAPTSNGLRELTVIYAVAPVVIKTSAIAIMWRFPLTAEKHATIRRRLGRLAAREVTT